MDKETRRALDEFLSGDNPTNKEVEEEAALQHFFGCEDYEQAKEEYRQRQEELIRLCREIREEEEANEG